MMKRMNRTFLGLAVAVLVFSAPVHAVTKAYVGDVGTGVSVVDTSTNTVTTAIAVGTAAGVTHLPDGSRVYVSGFDGGTVTVIDTASDSVVTGIPAGTATLGIAALPDGSRVYVADIYAGVQVIDTGSNTTVTTIDFGGGINAIGSFGVAVHTDGTKVYVTNLSFDQVRVIDAGTNTAMTNIAVGDGPEGIAILPDGSRLYVANTNDGTVSVVSTTTNLVLAMVAVGGQPFGVDALPDGSKVYVSNLADDTVSVIGTASDTVTATVSLDPGCEPAGLDSLPDSSLVYVACGGLDEVATIVTSTDTPGVTVAVGTQPVAFGDFIVDVSTPSSCGVTPDLSCQTGFQKGLLLVKENVAGKEKVLAKFIKGPGLSQADFGDPLGSGGTSYTLCIYDDGGELAGELEVDRAGDTCSGGTNDCWKSVGLTPPDGKGFKFKDKDATSDGVFKIVMKGGDAGKSKILVKGKNSQAKGLTSMPVGIAGELFGGASATVQLITSDADCFSMTLTDEKKNELDFFKFKLP